MDQLQIDQPRCGTGEYYEGCSH